MSLIIKEVLNSKIDFENWGGNHLFDIAISSNEDEPKHYPCIIVYNYIESEYIKDYVHYEFVYLDDFKNINNSTK